MHIHYLLTKRGRSLLAVAGIATAIALNGVTGGSASAADLQPSPAGCVTLPAQQGQMTTAPGTSTGGTSASPAPDGGSSVTTLPGQQDASGECFMQSAETTSPTISVQVCVNPDGTVVQSVPETGSVPSDPSGAGQPAAGTTGATTSGTAAAASGGVVSAEGALTVNQGTVFSTGAANSAATCVSISITNGQPAILSPAVPNATLQPAPDTLPANGGAPAAGGAVPAQPGAGSGTQSMPDTTPQPGQGQ